VSKNHIRLLEKFNDAPSGNVPELHVCGVCGFIAVDKIPEKCPVCNAVPAKFKTVTP
jgi:rubrerythrin